ncbi:4Fe-4S binding protein [Adlercreutzia caecimuris]|uniref:4Fe-4S binding protein n=1 Tax=Adlercreutzia caecimuris TaxID=671266 RepID=UPI00272DAA2A|nr:4Fe-4S binding protein [Adlercreutzia caecimuris]
MRLSALRKIVIVAIFACVAISLATHAATGTLAAFGYDSIALLCPLGALEAFFGAKEFLLHPMILLLVGLLLAVLFGKAFCAWACPTSIVKAVFRRNPKRDSSRDRAAALTAEGHESALTSKTYASGCAHDCSSCAKALKPVGGARDGFKFDSRFGVLAGTLLSAAVFGFPVFCLICPVGLIFATFIAVWHLFQFDEPTWGLLVFPAIVIVELVLCRTWCHSFCPISALLSFVSRSNRAFRPRVEAQRCLRDRGIDCRACVSVCPEQVDPHSPHIPECIKCGKCIEACPEKAITFAKGKIRLRPEVPSVKQKRRSS